MDNFRGQETGAGERSLLLICVPGKSHSHIGSGRGQWGDGTTDFVHGNSDPDSEDIFPKYSFSYLKLLAKTKALVPVISSW